MKRALDDAQSLSGNVAGMHQGFLGEQMPRTVVDIIANDEALTLKLHLQRVTSLRSDCRADMVGIVQEKRHIEELALGHPGR
ncbi:hypothetical protein D9M69_706150 [compost metagenome]